ncbi:hypothetical protein K439DRAFT_43997 [Ramaria rubella]|nr:hypothetical protein K439DRAFT_43997 [Ramaria rubella]
MKSLTIDSIFPGFAFAEVDLPDPDNHDGSTGEHKCNFPGCKLAERGFKRYCDLIRHLSTHDPKAKKRGCPYPGSKCKIQADEKYQLTNWFEHIVTVQ